MSGLFPLSNCTVYPAVAPEVRATVAVSAYPTYTWFVPVGVTDGYVTVVLEVLVTPVEETARAHCVPDPNVDVNCWEIRRTVVAAKEAEPVMVMVELPEVVTIPIHMSIVEPDPTNEFATRAHVVTPPPATEATERDTEVRLVANTNTSPTAVGDTARVVVPVPPEVAAEPTLETVGCVPGATVMPTRLLVESNTTDDNTAGTGGPEADGEGGADAVLYALRTQLVEATAVGNEPGPDHCEYDCT